MSLVFAFRTQAPQQFVKTDPVHRLQPVLNQTMETDVHVLGVLITAPEKFVDRIGEPTKIFVNSRGMPARIKSTSQSSHVMNVKVGNFDVVIPKVNQKREK